MTWTTTVTINGVDYTDETIERLTIVWGRTSVTQQPNPTTCSGRLLISSSIGTVDLVDVSPNSNVVVTAVPTGFPGAINRVRFVGVITDVDVSKNIVGFNATATGLYLLNRMPVETWSTFVYDGFYWGGGDLGNSMYQCWLAGVAFSGLDPATTEVPLVSLTVGAGPISEDYQGPRTTVGAQVQRYCSMIAGGAAFEGFEYNNKYGSPAPVYFTRVYASQAESSYTPALTLTADEVDYYWQASTDAGLVNTEAIVTYAPDAYPTPNLGVPASGVVSIQNPRYSTLSAAPVEIETKTAEGFGGPAELASFVAGRGYRPGPILNVALQLGTMTASRIKDVLQELYGNKLWETPQLHPSLPTLWFVQGYTETFTAANWTLQLRMAALGNMWLGQRWFQVTPTLQWDQVIAPDYSWAELQEVPL